MPWVKFFQLSNEIKPTDCIINIANLLVTNKNSFSITDSNLNRLIHFKVDGKQTKDGTFSTFCCLNVTKFRSLEDPEAENSLGVSKKIFFKCFFCILYDSLAYMMTLAKRFSDIQTERPCDKWYLVKLKKYLPEAGFLNSILSYEWNLVIYLVLVILVLAAVSLAVVILLFLVGLCFGGICAIRGKDNVKNYEEKRRNHRSQRTEWINEFPWRMKLSSHTSENSVTVPTYYLKISTMT